MNSFHAIIEALEPRQLLSVSAKTLAGPFTKGTSWTYNIYNKGTLLQPYTIKAAGVVTVGGLDTNELVETEYFSSAQETLLQKDYVHLGSKGLLTYKAFVDITNPSAEETRTIVYGPPMPQLPVSLTAKQTVTTSWASNTKVVDTPSNQTQNVTDSGKLSVELASETPSPLKTVGGKFSVYTVYTSASLTENGKTTKTKSTLYYAVGYGMVETDSGTESIQLLKFKNPPKAASAIAITASPFADGSDQKSLWSDVGD